ncbi:transmembrane amino acid transporter protein, putative [Ichthyophthirius multifiliis]|uniref:Transmembrane amino acid transporter protein, putative n=1 Tax=Ichthyophthirius multifiliis TaxID=5932 RepID=G0QLU4_ICHMU|nr:transmembrane amino acid transporter protein, putative [Ichthyophthirius multifiliis]EGR33812.1 transmembrane amino acid transporter protein, putative [Ichthyophthirius multifiliis]|eukprot:XP_004039036.1 transmembrane amino acid transporter protein, putative [Ichthyophthirius multifiliis]
MSLINAIEKLKCQKKEEQSIKISSFNKDTNQLKQDEQILKIQQNKNEDDINFTQIDEENIYKIQHFYEYSTLGLLIFGKTANIFISITLICNIIGSLTTKSITIGSILSNTFYFIPLLDNSNTWICIFFFTSLLFSFKNVQNTHKLQIIIVIIRIITILALIIGSFLIYFFQKNPKITYNMKLADFENFGSFFNNMQYGMFMHQFLPLVVSKAQNQNNISTLIFYTIFSGICIFITLCFSSFLAFGECINIQYLQNHNNDICEKIHNFHYYSNFFQYRQPIVFYMSSFYAFLNVSSFPIQIIVLRNNLIQIIKYNINMQFNISKYQSYFITVFISSPVLAFALLTNNIQLVLDYTSGIFGSFIMIIYPCLFVIKSRKMAYLNNGIDYQLNFLKSRCSNQLIPYLLIIIGVFFISYTLFIKCNIYFK